MSKSQPSHDPSQIPKEQQQHTDQLRNEQRILDRPESGFLTTDQGVPVADNQNQLSAGPRGPVLMEDFIYREKMTHFDHERMPQRVVHARGSGAHGYFEVYKSMAEFTKAEFLQDPAVKTPVFVRFSTVVGSRGSADTVRDVRGFATKFYTTEGNFDLVGNNMPVFFIQDAMKFPDLVHAIKPHPDSEMPQASAAHDNFWDFASLTPESAHMLMWVLSDRALPRSYAMMEGFGVHTFRLVNESGRSSFVKFHWNPLLDVHSLVWDETQKIAGKAPDFTQATLFWNSMSDIEKTHIVEAIHFELGKVERMYIRERMIQLFANIDRSLAERAASGVGVKKITGDLSYLRDSSSPLPNSKRGAAKPGVSRALSMQDSQNIRSAKTRKIAILVENGFDNDQVAGMVAALTAAGVQSKYISKYSGEISSSEGDLLTVDKAFVTAASVLFDAVFIPGGRASVDALRKEGKAIHWVNETFQHCKSIAAVGEGVDLLRASGITGVKLSTSGSDGDVVNDKGVVTAAAFDQPESVLEKVKDTIGLGHSTNLPAVAEQFIAAIAQDRHWSRTSKDMVPA